MISNLALITYSFEGAGIAQHFKESIGEGGKVIVGVIEKPKDILLPSEEETEEKNNKERLTILSGICDVYAADSVVEFLKKQTNKEEWFVFVDMNYCFKYAEQLAAFMPYGNFPRAKDRELEVDRDKAKQFIAEHYPMVAKDKHKEFKTVDEATKFLEGATEVYVLKGGSPDAPTVVPPTDDVETATELLLDSLEKNKDVFNAGGMILEVKLDDAIELTPECVFWNGVPVYYTLDIETKRKYAGDVGGELVGCGQDLVVLTKPEDKLNQIAFPPIVQHMAREAKGMFVWDLSLLISKRTGKMYPGEFCANRPGWNAFYTEVSGIDMVRYFNDLVKGENPLADKKCSSSCRFFNDEDDLAGVKIIIPDDVKDHAFMMDAKKDGEDFVTAGYMHDALVMTGEGDDLISSAAALYDNASKVVLSTKRWGYRSFGDYIDLTYLSSIPNRFNYAVGQGLISGYEIFEGFSGGGEKMKQEYEGKMKAMGDLHEKHIDALRKEVETILNG